MFDLVSCRILITIKYIPCQQPSYPPLWWRLCGCQNWWWILSVLLKERTERSREKNDQEAKVLDSSSSSLGSLMCSWGLQLGETSPGGNNSAKQSFGLASRNMLNTASLIVSFRIKCKMWFIQLYSTFLYYNLHLQSTFFHLIPLCFLLI